ncbi:MAG: hypothetical protein Q8K18_06065 [Burkholderiales bacterium]|nr:hypothetical protein [Burkholderiales bacterium]
MKLNVMAVAGLAVLWGVLTLPAVAAENKGHGAAEIRKDIGDHRALAEAHLNAAACLESGKSEKICLEQLAKDCKGLGIGKYCGMKHKH